jgi:hypothetical protein
MLGEKKKPYNATPRIADARFVSKEVRGVENSSVLKTCNCRNTSHILPDTGNKGRGSTGTFHIRQSAEENGFRR